MTRPIIVIIRYSGERTYEALLKSVAAQIDRRNIYTVSETPFEKTLYECYKIGIESDARWMLTIDADVLPANNAINEFTIQAEAMPAHGFQLEGLVFDKFTGFYRKAGHRIYRTEFLKNAIKLIPRNGTSIRPESFVVNQMERAGFTTKLINQVFGIHDFEQYYSDIYRKSYVYAKKHRQWLAHFFERWQERSKSDSDYLIALKGLYDGLLSIQQACIDTRQYAMMSKTAMRELSLEEKKHLEAKDVVDCLVKRVLQDAGEIAPENYPHYWKKITFKERMKVRYREMGILRFGINLLGSAFVQIGENIKGLAR